MTARILSAIEAAEQNVRALTQPTTPTVLPAEDARAILDAQALLTEARAILQNAQATLQADRQHARQKGHQEGLAATTELLLQAQQERASLLAGAETELAHMALELTRQIVGRHLDTDPEVMADMIARALTLAHGKRRIEVRVHPLDLTAVGSFRERLEQAAGGALALVEDAGVARHGSRIHTESGVIEADLDTQLDVLAEAMGLTLEARLV